MNKPKVYLAGPVTNLSFTEATNWRELAASLLRAQGIKPISPMRGSHHLLEKIDSLPDADERHVVTKARAITDRCEFDVRNCDVVLVNLLEAAEVSKGTLFEIAWAYMLRKPIVVIMEDKGNVHEHAMLRCMYSYRVTTLHEAVRIVSTLVLGEE